MYFRYYWFRHYLLSFIEIAFILNLIILDIVILGHVPYTPIAAAIQQHQIQTSITSPLAPPSPTPMLGIIPSIAVSPTLPPTKTTHTYQSISSVKEYYVPFGSGESSAGDWTNVTGLQTYIDSSQYPSMKHVVFEASVHIPTGNEWASVRLFNVTDQHPVWFSDVTLSGGNPLLLISSPITLDSGNKLYQVQMKTQLQYPAILDQSRIHITLQ